VRGVPGHIQGNCCASGRVVRNFRTVKSFYDESYESEKKDTLLSEQLKSGQNCLRKEG
jgi:hypothetical protein